MARLHRPRHVLVGAAHGVWVLPLFPAQPKLGPVYREVTHFIPWEFPLLLIVPAIILVIRRRAIRKVA